MTKIFMMALTALMVMGAASFVYAGDEFGSRFGNDTPTALRENKIDGEIKPQDIEPAAGDSAPKKDEEQKKDSAANAPVTTPAAQPAQRGNDAADDANNND